MRVVYNVGNPVGLLLLIFEIVFSVIFKITVYIISILVKVIIWALGYISTAVGWFIGQLYMLTKKGVLFLSKKWQQYRAESLTNNLGHS